MREHISRRQFLKGGGALVVTFSLAACSIGGSKNSNASGSASGGSGSVKVPQASPVAPLQNVTGSSVAIATPSSAAAPVGTPEAHAVGSADQVDSWLAIQKNGVTLYVGKVELGTGIQTALSQIIAEELDVPFEQVTVIQGRTGQTPDQGYTAGSQSIQSTRPVLQQAGATARQALLQLGATKLGTTPDQVVTKNGSVQLKSDASKSVAYADLLGGQTINKTIDKNATPKAPSDYTIVGKPIARVDIPGKLTGAMSYVQNLRLDGMLHGRVIRPWLLTPNGLDATLDSYDESSIKNIPNIVKVVRQGNFLGVVATDEWSAIQAARQLKVNWKAGDNLINEDDLFSWLRQQQPQDKVVDQKGDAPGTLKSAAKQLKASYNYPYQSHGSIGPSCAVADVRADSAVIYSGTQGVYPLRDSVAAVLGMPKEKVTVNYIEASGCYGHNGADDVAGDAAILSKAVGKPVRVQWMRQDEFAFEPKGPGMAIDIQAGLDNNGKVVAWDYGVWTPTHSTRPDGQPGNLIAGMLTGAAAAQNKFIGGDRNAPNNYNLPNSRITAHWLDKAILRPSALRTLGATANVFANEGFFDELAATAGADPVKFRLDHLTDQRAIDLINKVAEISKWQARPGPNPAKDGTGRGIAWCQYENKYAYVAMVAQVTVDKNSGQVRVTNAFVSHDCGLIVNPDGLTNQIEGAVIQSTSRALKERITWKDQQQTSLDWSSYPILTFPEVPDVQVALINRQDQPSLGAGEITACIVAAAIANAIFDATGVRFREMPFTPDRVKAALQSS